MLWRIENMTTASKITLVRVAMIPAYMVTMYTGIIATRTRVILLAVVIFDQSSKR